VSSAGGADREAIKRETQLSNPFTRTHRFITTHYDPGVEYDDLPGERRSARAREPVRRMARERGLDRLLAELHRTRAVPFEKTGLNADPTALEPLYAALPASRSQRVRDPCSHDGTDPQTGRSRTGLELWLLIPLPAGP